MNRKPRLIAISCAALGALVAAPSAQADFHQILIKEVSLGSAGNDSFVELQMYAPGQTQVMGKQIVLYSETGTLIGESTLDGVNANVANGESQRTILIGDTAVPDRDFTYSVFDESTTGLETGGALCFEGSNDCVSWGNFNESGGTLPTETGTPAPAIPLGSSLVRQVDRGCVTALDPADDSNNSRADFVLASNPTPRANTAPPDNPPCPNVRRCGGKVPTLIGSNGRDVLIGSNRRDVISGAGGGDKLRGRGGNDRLCGGGARDRLIGGGGRDRLFGGAGRDTLRGGGGRDVLRGGPGRDLQRQ